MATHPAGVFDALTLDHVEFYVDNVERSADWLVSGYGMTATSPTDDQRGASRSVTVTSGAIQLRLTRPLTDRHPAATYLRRHGDGVADIALLVPDASAAFTEAVGRGARPQSPPHRYGSMVTASIGAFGDVSHTFVQRDHPITSTGVPNMLGLSEVDHFAICVTAGTLDDTVRFYERVLDFDVIFTEKIEVGTQAMDSKVVQSRSGAVTLTLISPDETRDPGQIDDFLSAHGGAGVQHIAFTVPDILHTVSEVSSRGVEFLTTPSAYYQLLTDRLRPVRHSVDALDAHNVLVDEDHDGQLFQIFARSVHPRNTFFLELIERMGAKTFGSGNIKALYEAVEAQRQQERAA